MHGSCSSIYWWFGQKVHYWYHIQFLSPQRPPGWAKGGSKGAAFSIVSIWKIGFKRSFQITFLEFFFHKNHQIQLFLTLNYPYFDPDFRHKHCGPPGTCANGWKYSLKRPFRAKIWYIRKPGAKPPAAPNFLKLSQIAPNPRASEKTVKQLGAAGNFSQGPKNSFFITINW